MMYRPQVLITTDEYVSHWFDMRDPVFRDRTLDEFDGIMYNNEPCMEFLINETTYTTVSEALAFFNYLDHFGIDLSELKADRHLYPKLMAFK